MLVAGGTGLRGYEAHFSMRAGAAKALSSDPLITHEKFVHHSDSAKICRQRAAGKTPYTRILRTNNYLRLNFPFILSNLVYAHILLHPTMIHAAWHEAMVLVMGAQTSQTRVA